LAAQRPDEFSPAFQGRGYSKYQYPSRSAMVEIKRRCRDASTKAYPVPALKGRPKFIGPLRGPCPAISAS